MKLLDIVDTPIIVMFMAICIAAFGALIAFGWKVLATNSAPTGTSSTNRPEGRGASQTSTPSDRALEAQDDGAPGGLHARVCLPGRRPPPPGRSWFVRG